MKSYSGTISGMALLAVLAGVLPLLGQTAPEESAPSGGPKVLFIRRAGPGPGGQLEGGADVVWYSNDAAPISGPAGEAMPRLWVPWARWGPPWDRWSRLSPPAADSAAPP